MERDAQGKKLAIRPAFSHGTSADTTSLASCPMAMPMIDYGDAESYR